MTESLVGRIVEAVTEALSRQATRLDGLEQRVSSLEGRAMSFQGAWRPGAYSAGAVVQRDGGLWFALVPTSDQPGAGATGWRLVVKSGSFRDAR